MVQRLLQLLDNDEQGRGQMEKIRGSLLHSERFQSRSAGVGGDYDVDATSLSRLSTASGAQPSGSQGERICLGSSLLFTDWRRLGGGDVYLSRLVGEKDLNRPPAVFD
jgi:hypothetical protein